MKKARKNQETNKRKLIIVIKNTDKNNINNKTLTLEIKRDRIKSPLNPDQSSLNSLAKYKICRANGNIHNNNNKKNNNNNNNNYYKDTNNNNNTRILNWINTSTT